MKDTINRKFLFCCVVSLLLLSCVQEKPTKEDKKAIDKTIRQFIPPAPPIVPDSVVSPLSPPAKKLKI